MRYSPLGLIKALFETLFDLYPNKRRNVVHGDKTDTGWSLKELGEAYSNPEDAPGEKYYQDLLNQHLDEKEREAEIISDMLIENYEQKHNEDRVEGEDNKEVSEEEDREHDLSEGSQEAIQDESGKAGDMSETDFNESCDFNSDDFDADSGIPDYIG